MRFSCLPQAGLNLDYIVFVISITIQNNFLLNKFKIFNSAHSFKLFNYICKVLSNTTSIMK